MLTVAAGLFSKLKYNFKNFSEKTNFLPGIPILYFMGGLSKLFVVKVGDFT